MFFLAACHAGNFMKTNVPCSPSFYVKSTFTVHASARKLQVFNDDRPEKRRDQALIRFFQAS